MPHARRLRRPVHHPLPPASARTRSASRRRAHGWEVPADADDEPRPLARRHYRSQELARRGGAADRRARAAPLQRRRRPLDRPPRRAPTRSTSRTATATISTSSSRAAASLRSALGDLRFDAARLRRSSRTGSCTASSPTRGAQDWLSIECAAASGCSSSGATRSASCAWTRPTATATSAARASPARATKGIRDLVVKRGGALPRLPLRRTRRSTSSAGTAPSTRGPSRSSNFQPRVGLVHLPPTWHGTFARARRAHLQLRPAPARLPPARRSPAPTRTRPSTATRSSSTCAATSPRARASAPAASRTTPPASPHGPHPGAYEASIGARATDELAVMLDTFAPLAATEAAVAVEDPDYHASFIS